MNKPSFKETVRHTTITLDDVGLEFNVDPIFADSFSKLRKADYGEGFRMATAPELSLLLSACFENKKNNSAKKIIEDMGEALYENILGDTGVYFLKKGIFFQDHPNIKNYKIHMTKRDLFDKLGSHEEGGVIFSDDGSIRYVPERKLEGQYHTLFHCLLQTNEELAQNPEIIGLVGGIENAEKLSQTQNNLQPNYIFSTHNLEYSLQREGYDQEKTPHTSTSNFKSGYGCLITEIKSDFDLGHAYGVKEIGGKK
ncbi:MAG: hypothetical protein ABIB43_03830 [archaeon]